jgi:hypothetical protein
MFKNVAGQTLTVFAFDPTTNLPKSGDAANITAYVAKDGGAVTVLADTSATEKDATNAKGYYVFDLAQAETNGDKLLFTAKSSTANVVVLGAPAVVYTTTVGGTAPTVAQIADEVWTNFVLFQGTKATVPVSVSPKEALTRMAAMVCGTTGGVGTGTVIVAGLGIDNTVVTVTNDANFNRTGVTFGVGY